VDDIRVNDQNPGLRDYEASLLRLLDKLSNGMAVEINESGTAGACTRCIQSSSPTARNRSTYRVKPFHLSSETVPPIK
jgi:hypothetical protein